MPESSLLPPELLKTLLEPLLADFQYWFAESRSFLENYHISFLTSEEQINLLERVKYAQQEVDTVLILFKATDNQVGIEITTLIPWHQLVTECWQVSRRFRTEQSISPSSQDKFD